jgi:hypothetical protein
LRNLQDHDDFAAVHAEYRRCGIDAIRRASRGWVRDEDLPDLEQQLWLRVWQAQYSVSGARYDPARGAFTTYLNLVARSVCANEFQKNSHAPTNTALRLAEKTDRRAHLVGAESLPALRDEQTEARLVLQDVFVRFRAYATQVEEHAGLLDYLAACETLGPTRATPRRVARILGVSGPTAARLRQRALSLLAKLGVG